MNYPTTLHDAVTNGDKEKILNILQEAAVDLKSTDDDGNTLLHLTFKNTELVESQLIEILEIFLDRGIDIKAENKLGKTISHLAVERRMRGVIDLCLRRNAVSRTTQHRSSTIAHFAIEEECRKFHSFIDDDTVENYEPLERESSNFVDWMASRGVDFFHAKDTWDHSALHLANALNLRHVMLALLKRVDQYSQVDRGPIPLLSAFVMSSAAPDQYFHHKTVKPIPPSHYKNRHSHAIVKLILEKNRYVDDRTLTIALKSAITLDHDKSVVQTLLRRLNHIHGVGAGIGGVIHTFAMKFNELTDPTLVQAELSTLRTLIRKGANVDERDFVGNTHAQSMFRAHPSLQLLEILKRTTSFGMRADNGQNFLHIIAEHTDEPKMVDLVVKRRCPMEDTDDDEMTPLKMALLQGHDLVAMRLIELGARFKDVYRAGRTPLSIACQFGNARAAKKLVEYGADLGWRNGDGMTLLHVAIRENPRVVELLVKNGLDVNARDKEGKTPMHRAMTGPVVRTLFEAGARVDVMDNRGNSPLVNAMFYRGSEVVAELLRCGADMRAPKELEFAIRLCQKWVNIEEVRYTRWHLVKLSAAGLLDEERLGGKGMKPSVRKFFEECREEIDALKAFLVDDGTSLYKLLHKSPNRRSYYAGNEKLKNFVGDVEMERRFPNYFVLVAGCYNDAVARKPLLEAGIRGLNEFAGAVWPDLCADKILAGLSNADLRRFVEALENVDLKV